LEFEGTVVIVSHDRDFLQGLTSRLYEFKGGGIREHLGDINTYLEKRKIENLTTLEYKDKQQESAQKQQSENKLKWEQKKGQDKELRKLEKEIKQVEDDIQKTENKLAEINEKLAQPMLYPEQIQSGELFREHDACESKLTTQMHLWEALQEKLEQMRSE